MVTHTASRMLWPRAILPHNTARRQCFPRPSDKKNARNPKMVTRAYVGLTFGRGVGIVIRRFVLGALGKREGCHAGRNRKSVEWSGEF